MYVLGILLSTHAGQTQESRLSTHLGHYYYKEPTIAQDVANFL